MSEDKPGRVLSHRARASLKAGGLSCTRRSQAGPYISVLMHETY